MVRFIGYLLSIVECLSKIGSKSRPCECLDDDGVVGAGGPTSVSDGEAQRSGSIDPLGIPESALEAVSLLCGGVWAVCLM